MDRIEEYREIIKRVIREVADYAPAEKGVRKELIFDDEGGHYHLFQVGWRDGTRVQNVLVHIDIHNEKIYFEHDGTNLEVVDDLLDAGISKKEIMMGFHPPNMRQYTNYAQE